MAQTTNTIADNVNAKQSLTLNKRKVLYIKNDTLLLDSTVLLTAKAVNDLITGSSSGGNDSAYVSGAVINDSTLRLYRDNGDSSTFLITGRATPTWQETLTAGSTLTTNNISNLSGNYFYMINGSMIALDAGRISIGGVTNDSTVIRTDSLIFNISSKGAGKILTSDADGGVSFQSPDSLGLGNITGSLTTNTIPKATGANTLGNSLLSEGTNLIEQRNSTNPQTFNLYKSYTDASNYSRLAIYNSGGGNHLIQSQVAGTGVGGNLYIGTGSSNMIDFQTNSTSRWQMSGSNGHLLAVTDNATDIGASGATRPRTGYFGTSVIAPTITGTSSVNGGDASNSGAIQAWNSGTVKFYAGAGAVAVTSAGYYAIGSSSTNVFSQDVYLNRQGAGVFGVGTNSTNALGSLIAASYTVGNAAVTNGLAVGASNNGLVFSNSIFGEVFRYNNSGNIGIGTGSTISAKLHSLATTEQLRLGYSAAIYNSFTTNSSGHLTIAGNAGQTASFAANSWTIGQWGAAGNATLNAASGGAGNSNRAGIDLNIGSGQSTGNGAGGKIFFNYTPAGSSGTSLNAYSTAMTIEGTSGNVGIATTSPTKLLQIGTINPVISLKQATSAQQYDINIGLGTGLSSQKFEIKDVTSGIPLFTASSGASSGPNVAIGTTTPYASSSLYITGGSAGANIDAQANGTSSRESNIEAMAINYATGKGIAMRLWSDSLVSGATVLGNAKQHLALLDFNEDLNIIRTNNTNPLIFGVNDVEKARLDVAGTLTAVTLKTTPVAFASLPTGAAGMIATINDSNTDVWGATAAGGGALTVMIFFNGTNWTVIGK